MDWFRRSTPPTLKEHLAVMHIAEMRVLELQRKLHKEVTTQTLDELSAAFEDYVRAVTSQVSLEQADCADSETLIPA